MSTATRQRFRDARGLATFRDRINDLLVDQHVSIERDAAPFAAELTGAELGPARLLTGSVPPLRSVRSRRRPSEASTVHLLWVSRGSAVIEPDGGRAFEIRRDRLAAIPDDQHFIATYPDRARVLFLSLGRDFTDGSHPELSEGIRCLDLDGLARRSLAPVARHALGPAPSPPSAFGEFLRGWLAIVCARHEERSASTSELLRRAALREIDRSAGTVSVGRLAEQLAVSTRHLHRAFEGSGRSVGRAIRERRLDEAERLLRDPDGPTVTEISVRLGFSSPSHLASAFRERFGTSPTRHRRQAPSARI